MKRRPALILYLIPLLLSVLISCSEKKPEQKASLYIKAGDERFYAADFRGALKEYSKAVTSDSSSAIGHIKLGNALFCTESGRKGALKEYGKAELLSDDLYSLLNDKFTKVSYYGYQKWQEERIDKIEEMTGVIHDFSEAIDSVPGSEKPYLGRAFWKLIMCNYYGALSDYQKATSINPRSAEGYYGAGLAEFNLQNYPEAIRHYHDAVILEPENSELYRHLAAAKANLGDTTGAIQDLDHALFLDPDNPRGYMERAFYKLQIGDKKGAVRDLYTARNRCDSLELAQQIGIMIAANE